MKKLGRGEEVPETKRILELNAGHPAVQALQALHRAAPDDPRVEDYARLLYDQAVIAEGSTVKDPAAMARRINALLARDAGRNVG
jgi:molecular chaperone HtpG